VAGVAGFTMGTDVSDGVTQVARAQARGEWNQEAKLIGGDIDEGDNLGSAVAVDGETVLLGAPGDGEPNGPSAGSA